MCVCVSLENSVNHFDDFDPRLQVTLYASAVVAGTCLNATYAVFFEVGIEGEAVLFVCLIKCTARRP